MNTKKRTQLPRNGIHKILIRGTNWIGDAVMTLPAVASIRATYPESHLAVLAKPWVADIYRLFSGVDEIIIFESRFDTPSGIFRLAGQLKKRKFDAAILLQNAIEAAIIALAAGIPLRAGYDTDARGLLLTHSVKRTASVKKVRQTLYYLDMVKALGCPSADGDLHLKDRLNPAEAQKTIEKFVRNKKNLLIGIAPGATYGAAKRWFPDRFAKVADKLFGHFPAQIILLGGKDDGGTAHEIAKTSSVPLLNLAGKTTLREAIYLIAQCDLFISNDSGLMHIAGALNIPTLAIFGSTNPVTTGPLGNNSVIIRKEVSCSPCLKETCPKDFRCMKLISVDDVFDEAQKLLRKTRGSQP